MIDEQRYRAELSSHDWWYDYSDDHRAWSAGHDHYSLIQSMQQQIDKDCVIWNELAPVEFRRKVLGVTK